MENKSFDSHDKVVPLEILELQKQKSLKRVEGVNLTWIGLSSSVQVKTKGSNPCSGNKEEKQILKNISGTAEPGQLVAIMGSSGAGKTTFLNILSQQNDSNMQVSGKIQVNGKEMSSDITNYSSYVQQQDIFYGTLTVREQTSDSIDLSCNLLQLENHRDTRPKIGPVNNL